MTEKTHFTTFITASAHFCDCHLENLMFLSPLEPFLWGWGFFLESRFLKLLLLEFPPLLATLGPTLGTRLREIGLWLIIPGLRCPVTSVPVPRLGSLKIPHSDSACLIYISGNNKSSWMGADCIKATVSNRAPYLSVPRAAFRRMSVVLARFTKTDSPMLTTAAEK